MDFVRIKYSQQVSKPSRGKNYFHTVVRKTRLGLEGLLKIPWFTMYRYKRQALFEFIPFNGRLYCRILFIVAQLDNQQTIRFSTFSGDVNLAHIFSSVVTDGCLINSCSLQWKLEEKQNTWSGVRNIWNTDFWILNLNTLQGLLFFVFELSFESMTSVRIATTLLYNTVSPCLEIILLHMVS